MKHKFQFDKKSGTMVPAGEETAPSIKPDRSEVVETPSAQISTRPVFKEKRQIINRNSTVNVEQNQMVKMQRTNKPTPVQLVNEDGLPESYLDSITTGIMMFREQQDYDICQITDERTGKVLAYIGGYALAFNFNMSELRSMEKIEQCLQGIVKLLRHKIMTQTLGENQEKK